MAYGTTDDTIERHTIQPPSLVRLHGTTTASSASILLLAPIQSNHLARVSHLAAPILLVRRRGTAGGHSET